MSETAKKIQDAIEFNGIFLSTGGIASWLKLPRSTVIAAFDELQAKHPKRFMRIRGLDGGMGPL